MVDVADETVIDSGRRFAAALAGKRPAELAELLAPDVDFRGLTPGRDWQASSPEQVIAILFDHWFEPTDVLDELVAVDTSTVEDRQHVSYRLRGHDADGPFVVEQQAYFMTDDDQPGRPITWMRVLCSGFRRPTA